MNKDYLGIDLGTSSVKLILRKGSGCFQKTSSVYEEKSLKGWENAILLACRKLDLANVAAIGLSSQVGTYIINEKDIISWQKKEGKDELHEILEEYDTETFLREISMKHPEIISYPIPRIKYIKKHFSNVKSIRQPKDLILKILTGNDFSDKYSWRGLSNIEKGCYSKFFMNALNIDERVLPPLKGVFDKAGTVTKEFSEKSGVKEGTAVYTGLNDFYASLIGMGVNKEGQLFDITGTSEHLGTVKKEMAKETKLVASEFFGKFVEYGVTASSGVSLDFALSSFDMKNISLDMCESAPIFTPYLKGERAPVFDSEAVGNFLGITEKTTSAHMAYSVLEGVAFSIYHIYETLGIKECKNLIICGGASKNEILNKIKLCLLNSTGSIPSESDTSALGALIVATVGDGLYKNCEEACNMLCSKKTIPIPCENYRGILMKRFEVYKKIYESEKQNFKEFRRITK